MAGGNFALYYVENEATLADIVQRIFGMASQRALQDKVNDLRRLNPWIQNPEKIPAGSLVMLGPADGATARPPTRDEVVVMERELATGVLERDKFFDAFPLFQGAAASGFSLQAALPQALTFLTTPAFKEPYRAFKGAVKVGNEATKGLFGSLITRSPHLWQDVEGKLIRDLQRNIQYVSQSDGVARLVPNGARAFAKEGRVLIVNPTLGEFRGYADAVKKTKAVGTGILAPVGTVLKGVDLGLYANNIREAYGTPEQNRTFTTETAKYGASLYWSSVSVGASGTVCGYLTLAGGYPGVACSFVVVVGGSFASSKVAEKTSGWAYDAAKWAYDRVEEQATDVARVIHQGIYKLYFPGGLH